MAKKDNFKKVFTKYAEEYLDTRIQNVFQKVALSIFDKLMREDMLFQNQTDRKSTRLNSSHMPKSRMPSSA